MRGRAALLRLGQNIDVAGLKSGEAAEKFRHQRPGVFDAVGGRSQNHDGEGKGFELLLMWQAFVHRQKDVKLAGIGDEPEQLAVLDARPTGARDSLHLMAGQIPPETRRHTFIKDDAHLRGDQHPFAGFFEKGDGLFAGNGGEILQKIIERIAAFEVVNQRAGGNARPGEAGRAAHDFRVNLHNGAFLHADN